MKRLARRLTAAPVILGLLCLSLGVLLFAELSMGPIDVETEIAGDMGRAAEPVELDTRAFAMPPLSEYAEVTRRPLFAPSRRPAEPGADGGASGDAAKAEVPFVLSGVIVADGHRTAVLRRTDNAKTVTVAEGGEFDGWRLDSIGLEAIVVRNGATTTELTLEETLRANVTKTMPRRQAAANDTKTGSQPSLPKTSAKTEETPLKPRLRRRAE